MEYVQIEVVKVIDKNKTYKAKNGKEYTNVNYYIVFNGTWVAIRPSFKGGYSSLDMISRKIVNGADNVKEDKKPKSSKGETVTEPDLPF